MVLPDSVDNAVLVTSVEKSDVSLLVSVLSGSLDGKEVDNEDSSEASLLVLASVVDGAGVGPEVGVTSVEMLVDTSLGLSVLEPV